MISFPPIVCGGWTWETGAETARFAELKGYNHRSVMDQDLTRKGGAMVIGEAGFDLEKIHLGGIQNEPCLPDHQIAPLKNPVHSSKQSEKELGEKKPCAEIIMLERDVHFTQGFKILLPLPCGVP